MTTDRETRTEGRGIKAPIEVRPYRDGDEPAVLSLLRRTLGGGPAGRAPGFFRWKHGANPFGGSFMLVAESEGRIVGLRAFMRWRLVAGGRVVKAVRAVDTATDPDFQRLGIFSRLTRRALDELGQEVDLVFNTPNTKSGPGYLKMGWLPVGRVSVSLRVRRPLRFLRRLRSARSALPGGKPEAGLSVDAEPAGEALADAGALASLLDRARVPEARLATWKDPGFLRWRYGDAPLLDYRAVREERAGRLDGLAVFRVRPRGPLWQSSVAEVIVPHGDVRAARRLLLRVGAAAPVDYLVFRMPSGSTPARAARRSGFVWTPGGLNLVVNPLTDDLSPDPANVRSWALTLGDLEVF